MHCQLRGIEWVLRGQPVLCELPVQFVQRWVVLRRVGDDLRSGLQCLLFAATLAAAAAAVAATVNLPIATTKHLAVAAAIDLPVATAVDLPVAAPKHLASVSYTHLTLPTKA